MANSLPNSSNANVRYIIQEAADLDTYIIKSTDTRITEAKPRRK